MDRGNRRYTPHIVPGPGDRYPQPGRDPNNPYVNPGFEIVDSGRTITPKDNQWQKGNEKADFDAAVKRVTNWDADNFQGAYDAAAKNGTGVTFVVGSMTKKDTQDTLKNLEALKAKNPNMQIVFFDTDKIKDDPKYQGLRDWVQKNTNNDDLTFMAQYSVRPGEGGKPMGDKLVSTHWGSDTNSLDEQQKFGKIFTEKYKGQFKIPEGQPEVKPQPSDKPTVPQNPHQAAISEADKINQQAVSSDLEKVNAAIAEAQKAGEAGAKQLPELLAQQKKLQAMREAPARTRKEYAQKLYADAVALNGKTDEQSLQQQEASVLEAHRQINDANAKVPGYFASDAAKQELKAMGYSDQAIVNLGKTPITGDKSKYWLSENQYGVPEADKKKMYEAGDDAALESATREALEAAIADAKAKGVPLVIKYGLKGCPPCIAMDNQAMNPTSKDLAGKAVVANVDGPAAESVLREHGYQLKAPKGFPFVDGFDVSASGNLTRGQNGHLEGQQLTVSTENGIDATPTKTSIPQMVEGLRAERAARIERERQANEQAAKQALEAQRLAEEEMMKKVNALLKLNPYQFTGDGVPAR